MVRCRWTPRSWTRGAVRRGGQHRAGEEPVRVARAVLETPHLVLAGDGATQFARTLGLPDCDSGTPERRRTPSG
jgi:isoaspartyl peptidase/L-asparaginase-like protein (Ntn-hydrolase superfamily)